MLIYFIVVLIVVGVLLYLFNTLVPMDQKIRTVINVVVGLAIFLYALQVFGILPNFPFNH